LGCGLDRLLQLKKKSEFIDLIFRQFWSLLKAILSSRWLTPSTRSRQRKENPAVTYVLPGRAPCCGRQFVIPANSPSKVTAEVFLNFLLRPEINARIANENFYATPNGRPGPISSPKC